MANNSEQPTIPVGIDLGTTNTVSASVVGGTYQLLRTTNGESVPTEFALGPNGFLIGQEAEERADSVTPLPYIERTERSMTATPKDVPLAIFLEKLLSAWQEQSIASSDDDSESADDGAEVARNEENVGNTREEFSESSLEFSVGSSDDRSEGTETTSEASPGSGESISDRRGTDQDSQTERSGSVSPPQDGESDASAEQLSLHSAAIGPTTVTVPGGYSREDITDIETVATAAGFDEVTAIRNPLAIAAAESVTIDSKTTIGVVDIGTNWVEFAVITIDSSGKLSVNARTSLSDHGRTALDNRLVEWTLKQVESDHDISLECTDKARERLRDAIHQAVNQVGPDGELTGSIDVELSDGVTLTEGGLFGKKSISIQEEFDLESCVQALRPMLENIQQTASSMLDDLSDTEMDDLVLAGDGSHLAPVLIAIENAFDIRSRLPARGNRYTAAAIGAATISEQRAAGKEVVSRETASDTLVLRAMGDDGVDPRPISSTATGQGSTVTMNLRPISEDQLSGSFQIGFQHKITSEIRDLQTFACTNIPSNTETSDIVVEVKSTAPSVNEEAINVSASLKKTADRDVSLSVQRIDELSHPWLAHTGINTGDLDLPADVATVPEEGISNRTRALESIDSTGVARAAWKMRNRIWEQTVRTDEQLTEDEIQLFLRELDKNLRIEGVEIIEPDVGERLDTDRHSVASAEEADEPEGTILEVLSPGFAVEGTVIEPAEIKAAR
jgi:molecular chaperone DnaK (HSP70)